LFDWRNSISKKPKESISFNHRKEDKLKGIDFSLYLWNSLLGSFDWGFPIENP
jgi:hypothetical protein